MLEKFLTSSSKIPKLIVIYGPTASGKTDRSIQISRQLSTEIISADSRQIYRMMNIGTAKVTQQEMQWVPHHMIDIVDVDTQYSVGDWLEQVEEIIQDLHNKNQIPIICWGTGLYIDALMYNYDMPNIGVDPDLRDELIGLQQQWNQKLWDRLYAIDPEYAKQLHPNNHRYVLRGIEVKEITGKSKQEYGKKTPRFDVHLECPGVDSREELYQRINLRVQLMFEQWLAWEIQSILEKYGLYSSLSSLSDDQILQRLPGLNSIGYREVFSFMRDEISLDVCIEKIQTNTRHYAKRQLTWFRKYGEGSLFEREG